LNLLSWEHKPFSPARWPFFYGWALVAFGAVGVLASMPGQTIGMTALAEHLMKALGLTREQLTRAYMFGTLGSGLVLPYAGRLCDRFGVRIIAPAASLGMGLVLLALSQADHISVALAETFGAPKSTVPALCVMIVGFFFLRFFGQGVLTLVSRNMVMKWFQRHRGLVNGILGVVLAFGFSFSPKVMHMLVEHWEWRGAWWILGLVIGGGFTLFALLLFRDNPEACGLQPDGSDAPPEADDPTAHLHDVRQPYTLRQAQCTLAFWVFGMALGMFALFGTAATFHIVSLFENAGLGKAAAFAIFSKYAVISACVLLTGGWLSDRMKLKHLLACMCASMIAAMVALTCLGPSWATWLLIFGMGTTTGLFSLLIGLVWPTYYGRKYLGAVSGFAMAILVWGSAVGPWLFSQSLAQTGSYRAINIASLIVTALLFVASFWADNPQQKIAKGEDNP
jgi:MFS family permease